MLDAVRLLGRTLRDPAEVRAAHAAARVEGAHDVARLLLVARGLLGDPLELCGLLGDLREPEDLPTAILATLLVHLRDARTVFTDALRRTADRRIAAALTSPVEVIDAEEPFRVVDAT